MLIRGEKVMLAADTARLYGVTVGRLFEAIRQLMAPPARARRSIDFRVEKPGPTYRVRRRPPRA